MWFRYLQNWPDSTFYFGQIEYDFAQSRGLKKKMASALYLQGAALAFQGDFAKAIDYSLRVLKLDEEFGDKNALANDLRDIGTQYAQLGNYPRALDYFRSSLKLWEELGDKNEII